MKKPSSRFGEPVFAIFFVYTVCSNEKPFDLSLMVRFRQCFNLEQLNAIKTKLVISFVDGFAYLEKLSWDNFNEGMTLSNRLKDTSSATTSIGIGS